MTPRRCRLPFVLVALVPLGAGCERVREPAASADAPSEASPGTLWRELGDWSGRGDRQTESFDVTTGALRLTWEALDGGGPGTARLRVSLHSAISGRPIETIVDLRGAGAGTVNVGAEPRVAYLRIESEQVDWQLRLEEGVRGAGGTGPARE